MFYETSELDVFKIERGHKNSATEAFIISGRYNVGEIFIIIFLFFY